MVASPLWGAKAYCDSIKWLGIGIPSLLLRLMRERNARAKWHKMLMATPFLVDGLNGITTLVGLSERQLIGYAKAFG